jgi:response regulator RpfG family c-di-GMP phosphodiesterase
MKHKIVTKLWLGKYVSVRDYELKAAIQEGGMIIEYLSEKMHLSVDDIKHIKPSGKFHEAKFVGNIKSYQLADITWKPNDSEQKELFL